VDVLNALLRNVTSMRVDKVDKEVKDVTPAFYSLEPAPPAKPCTEVVVGQFEFS
jgi:hypothetical protein